MTRYVRVPIEVEERACGKCRYCCKGFRGDLWCELFLVKGESRKLGVKDGAPQRCSQCLAAEVKTEVPNG
jgi:hypothetical protein